MRYDGHMKRSTIHISCVQLQKCGGKGIEPPTGTTRATNIFFTPQSPPPSLLVVAAVFVVGTLGTIQSSTVNLTCQAAGGLEDSYLAHLKHYAPDECLASQSALYLANKKGALTYAFLSL